MAPLQLFNWEIEKRVTELLNAIEYREATRDTLETFVLENSYYDGESDDVYVLLCNAYYRGDDRAKADTVSAGLFEKWKIDSNKFPDEIKRQKYLVDLVVSRIDYIPAVFFTHFTRLPRAVKTALTGFAVGCFVKYDKAYLLDEFLNKVPYDGNDSAALFQLINASTYLDGDKINEYLNRVLEHMDNPAPFLTNVQFTPEIFAVINPEILNRILKLRGIKKKFDAFIRYDAFLEALDKIPELSARFYIDISNQLYEKSAALSMRYAVRATRKPDFILSEHLKDVRCSCEKDPPDEPSIAETLMIAALKKGDFRTIWTIIENSYFKHARRVEHLDAALKYTAAAVKLSGMQPEMIAKHILFLYRRMRSVNGPDGIIEGDRFKYKDENIKFSQQIESYRLLYRKRTGKNFMI